MEHIISVEELENTPSKTLEFHFDEKIKELDCVTPIKSDLEIKSLGEFIEISGNIKGVLKLECDLCLKEFEYELDFDIDEMFAKNALLEDYGQELELKEGQFVTDLEGADEIDIYDLLYQSVILNLPNKKVCGINCNGDKFLKEEDLSDPRLDVFKNIKIDNDN
ncbi:putative uncharacterized protein [Clostridium sp. CAG:967]|nr:putative uncharacterized protein [Clostridium sp. CAG:967]